MQPPKKKVEKKKNRKIKQGVKIYELTKKSIIVSDNVVV